MIGHLRSHLHARAIFCRCICLNTGTASTRESVTIATIWDIFR